MTAKHKNIWEAIKADVAAQLEKEARPYKTRLAAGEPARIRFAKKLSKACNKLHMSYRWEDGIFTFYLSKGLTTVTSIAKVKEKDGVYTVKNAKALKQSDVISDYNIELYAFWDGEDALAYLTDANENVLYSAEMDDVSDIATFMLGAYSKRFGKGLILTY